MARAKDPSVDRLDEALKSRAVEGVLWERMERGRVRCVACGHRCVVLPGLDGICRVRFNRGGTLFVPRGYVAGLQADPVEKKPFFHALPGATALSFGMLGCDFHCGYCQNWLTSQTLRDPAALSPARDVEPEALVAAAKAEGAEILVSTYNEPLITSEWAVEVFRVAKAEGIVCGYVSNGNATPEVLEYIRPYVDLYKVDLKGFRQEAYRDLGGRLDAVLDAIRRIHAMGFWLEIVTLLVPGFNDSEEELKELTGFLADISSDIPWHVTAFHRDYKMTDGRDTSADDLLRAAEIGREAGLRHVYAGNLPGSVGDFEDTRCPSCARVVIARRGFRVLDYRIADGGRCSGCGEAIAGRWRDGWTIPATGRGPFAGIPRALRVVPGSR